MSLSEAPDHWSDAHAVAASDPAASGVMAGWPPPESARVTLANWLQAPQVRWAVRHTREVLPTAEVPRAGPVAELPRAGQALEALGFTDLQGRERTLGEYLRCNPIDGFLVLQHGRVLLERYPGSMQPHELHTLASVTKSFTGLMACWAVHEGLIDPDRPLSHCVPELKGTPCGDASLRDNLDLAVAIDFPPDQPYNYGYWAAAGAFPQKPGGPASVYEFVARVGRHAPGTGRVMQYQSNSPEAVNWALQRVTGQRWIDWVGEHLWSRLGVERDACMVVDRAGMPLAAGGLNVTLRDLGRFGAMLCAGGWFNGQQIMAPAVVDALFAPAYNHQAFASGSFAGKAATSGVRYSYRNYWYQTGTPVPAFQAHGILSQYLHVVPGQGLVIVQLASTAFDRPLTLPSFNRLALALGQALAA